MFDPASLLDELTIKGRNFPDFSFPKGSKSLRIDIEKVGYTDPQIHFPFETGNYRNKHSS